MKNKESGNWGKIKLVIFDLDGTIGDTVPLCLKAFRSSLEPLINRSLSDTEIVSTFGPSEEGTIMALAPECYKKGVDDYLYYYKAFHEMCPAPFDGIKALLEILKKANIRVAMVTGKGKNSTRISLEKFGIEDYFEIIETGVFSGPSKPDGLRKVIDYYKDLSKDELVYVGDAPSDIMACREVGIAIISAAWAPDVRVEDLALYEPDLIFDSIDELTHWVLKAI